MYAQGTDRDNPWIVVRKPWIWPLDTNPRIGCTILRLHHMDNFKKARGCPILGLHAKRRIQSVEWSWPSQTEPGKGEWSLVDWKSCQHWLVIVWCYINSTHTEHSMAKMAQGKRILLTLPVSFLACCSQPLWKRFCSAGIQGLTMGRRSIGIHVTTSNIVWERTGTIHTDWLC